MHALILPATPLLVPGLTPGLRTDARPDPGPDPQVADPLAAVRRVVVAALAELVADGRLPLVLAHGPVLRWGRLRPSLAGSGISDRWLPGPVSRDLPAAGTGASVALLALAEVLGERVADVETLEVPADWVGPDAGLSDGAVSDGGVPDGGPAALLGGRRLVVAGGGVPGGLDNAPDALTDGIRAALRAAGADAWEADVQVFKQAPDELPHGHLPTEYQVTTLS